MNSTGRSNLFRLFTAAGVAMLMASCSGLFSHKEKPPGQITNVKYFLLDLSVPLIPSDDPSILFERQYHLYGAVNQKDVSERAGHYYTVFWSVADRTQPVKVRLEYRQQKTGLAIKTKEMEINEIGRSNITRFQVTGDEFLKDGHVSCFHITLVRGKEILADNKSFMWERK